MPINKDKAEPASTDINNNNALYIANYLRIYHAALFYSIQDHINRLVPYKDKAKDFSAIPYILFTYLQEKGIKLNDLTDISNKARFLYRKEFLCIVLLIYQPEKIHRLTNAKTTPGIITICAELLNVNCNVLTNYVPTLPVLYRNYTEFRNTVNDIHQRYISTLNNSK